MTITGIIKYVSPITSVVSQTTGKTYSKLDFEIEETEEKFPQSALLTLFDDKIQEFLPILQSNALVTAKFDIKCKTSKNGNKFNSHNAWNVSLAAAPQQAQPMQPQPQVVVQQSQQWAQGVAQQFDAQGVHAQPIEGQSPQGNGDLPF